MNTETIDIVALVNNNPLTKLTSDYGSEMIKKIQEKFKEEDQQLFVANFYCYLNYKKTDYVIDFDRIWKWLGYTRIADCKHCLIRHFKENIDFKIEKAASTNEEVCPKIQSDRKNLGGAGMNKERITLTINCFKKLCLKSRTERADKIHDYYIQLEELVNEVASEQSEELRKKLLTKDKENEKSLIINFRNRNVVYLIIVEENGKMIIIKYGETKNIEKRMMEHRQIFGNDIKLVMVFETNYNKQFEQKIEKRFTPYIKSKIYKKTNQTELIHLTEDFTYDELVKQIEQMKTEFSEERLPELRQENIDLKLKLAEYEARENIVKLNKLTTPIQLPPSKLKSNQHRIQVYDENLKLIKTYETIRDVHNETVLFRDINPQTLYKSITNNTLYKGYRFWKIERNEEVKEYEIPETIELSKEQTHQRVVQSKDDKIIGIWSCTKEAAENLHKSIQEKTFIPKDQRLTRSTVSQINKSITNSLSNYASHSAYEHRWYRESDIPEDLLNDYEEYKSNNVLPEVKIHKNNKRVYKFDENNTLVHTYNSITEARKSEGLSEKIINKHIADNTLHNSHYFKLKKD